VVTIGRMLATRAAIVGSTQNGNGCIDSMGLKRRRRVLDYGFLYKIPLQGLGLGYHCAWVNRRWDQSFFSDRSFVESNATSEHGQARHCCCASVAFESVRAIIKPLSM